MKDYKYCDPVIFKSTSFGSGAVRDDGFIDIPAKLRRRAQIKSQRLEKSNAQPIQPGGIYIENMHGSQLISSSPHASIKETAPKLGLEKEPLDQLNADLATIEAQIESPAPKYTVTGESAYSIRGILESVAGNVMTQALLVGIGQFFS